MAAAPPPVPALDLVPRRPSPSPAAPERLAPPLPAAALTPALSRAPQELAAAGVVDELPPLGHALAEGLLRFLGHGEARSGCVAHPGGGASQAERTAASARSQALSNAAAAPGGRAGGGQSGRARPSRLRRRAGPAAAPRRPQPIPARRAPAPWRRPLVVARWGGCGQQPVSLPAAGGGEWRERGEGTGWKWGAAPEPRRRCGDGWERRRRDIALSGEREIPRRGSNPKWHLRHPPAAFPRPGAPGVWPQAPADPRARHGRPPAAGSSAAPSLPAPPAVSGCHRCVLTALNGRRAVGEVQGCCTAEKYQETEKYRIL